MYLPSHSNLVSKERRPLEITSLVRIGQLAKRCDKTVRALHLYEEMGLLTPTQRTAGGFRLYDSSAVSRVHFISRLQEAGLSLTDIQHFLQVVTRQPGAQESMTQLRSMLEAKVQEIQQQRQNLLRLEEDLQEALQYLDSCKHCQPSRLAEECPNCRLHGHDGQSPILVAGIHHRASTVHGEIQ